MGPRRPLGSARSRLSIVLLVSAINSVALLVVVMGLKAHMEAHHELDTLLVWPLPWILVGTVLSSLGVLWMAVGLRALFGRPLERLSAAARRISGGALEAPIPPAQGAEELRHLSLAMESMRQRLVESIGGLDQHNQLLKTMLEALGDGVLFLDHEGRVLEHNPRAAVILDGLPTAGALLAEGVPLRAAFPELPPRLFRQTGDDEVQLPISVFPSAGRARHLMLRVFPVREAGLGRSFVAVVRDVTEDHEIERLKTEFLSVITHELKTPLTAIDGFVRLMLQEKPGPLTPRQKTALETVLEQSWALRRMIQDLLDTTRLESGTLPVDMQSVPLRSLAQEVVEAQRPAAEARGLRLECEAEDVTVQADPFRLKQVLANLVSNATKFTSPPGLVRVEVRTVDGEVELSVQDTGRGIPAAALDKLFRKFYQVEHGDTRDAGGAGLGLYICQQLVTRMGGTIRAESELGKGSRFVVGFVGE